LFREALRCYLQTDAQWKALLLRTWAAGEAREIKSEQEVERLADKYRDAKR
jgi:hypothetical protein